MLSGPVMVVSQRSQAAAGISASSSTSHKPGRVMLFAVTRQQISQGRSTYFAGLDRKRSRSVVLIGSCGRGGERKALGLLQLS